jgi:hypothetical protein
MNVNFTAPQPTIVTREAAKASGAVWYYTGVPCRRGHTAMRYTRSGHCAGCLSNKKPGDVDMRTAPRVVQGSRSSTRPAGGILASSTRIRAAS